MNYEYTPTDAYLFKWSLFSNNNADSGLTTSRCLLSREVVTGNGSHLKYTVINGWCGLSFGVIKVPIEIQPCINIELVSHKKRITKKEVWRMILTWDTQLMME